MPDLTFTIELKSELPYQLITSDGLYTAATTLAGAARMLRRMRARRSSS